MSAPLQELQLQVAIERHAGTLVEMCEEIMRNLGQKVGEIEANQLRNVMAVASAAPHPAIVTNFIRYQMGRKGAPGDAWKGTGLGDAVITAIDEKVQSLATEVGSAVKRTDQMNVIQAQMTRLLLGFLYRSYVYEADRQESVKRSQQREGRK